MAKQSTRTKQAPVKFNSLCTVKKWWTTEPELQPELEPGQNGTAPQHCLMSHSTILPCQFQAERQTPQRQSCWANF